MFHLGHFFLSWFTYYIKGWSLRYSPGWGNPPCCAVMRYVGEGSEKEQCHLLHSLLDFSHFFRYPQSNWALLVLLLSLWVCVHSRTLWVSPVNSPMRLGVSPAAASIPTGVFDQRFEALFPRAVALGCIVCCCVRQLPPCLPRSSSHCLAVSPLCLTVLLHPSHWSG